MQDSCMQQRCGVLLLLLRSEYFFTAAMKVSGTKGLSLIIVVKCDFHFRNRVTLLVHQLFDVDQISHDARLPVLTLNT